jgi:hypothetical protein
MSTLVCVVGNARGSDVAWESLLNNVIKPLNVDLAILFGAQQSCDFLEKIATYNWNFDEPQDWGDLFDEICSEHNITNSWRETAQKTSYEGLWGGAMLHEHVMKGSGAIAILLRHMLLSHLDTMLQYDTIILTRSDHLYLAKHHITDRDNIFVPRGEDWWGITDRHYVFPSASCNDVLGVAVWLMKNHSKITECISRHHNPEQLLKLYFEDIGIYDKILRCKRCMVTVATEHDQTRWKRATVPVPGYNNLFLKYPHEYFSYLPSALRVRQPKKKGEYDRTGRVFFRKGLRTSNLT